ncbi:MAG: YceI family protein [Sulfurimonas sp.]
MKKILLATLLGLSTTLFAVSSCKYSADKTELTWTAFKTPEKIAVKGSFNHIEVNFDKSSSKKELLKSSTAQIFTASVNSNNKGRDEKLVQNFFIVQGVRTIDAKVVDVHKKSADVEISMNRIKKIISMNIEDNDQGMILKGSIDLADFKMLPSLNSITQACYDLHKGKTWQDVDLEFKIYSTCK